jgi:hypothetical protein
MLVTLEVGVNVTVARLAQSLNVYPAILVTLLGIVMLDRLVQLLNA